MDEIQIYPTSQEVAQAAAETFIKIGKIAVEKRQVFSVALAGGSTPKLLYQLLAEVKEYQPGHAWDPVHFFFGDERTVPPDHQDSNFHMVVEALFSRIDIPVENIHRIRAENPDANAAASNYENELKSFFSKQSLIENGFPKFDLILLGMGTDGHTASLFPDSAGLLEQSRWVIANEVEKLKTKRITLTFPVLNQARNILFLVTGKDKTEIVREVLEKKPANPPLYPIQRIVPVDGSKTWLLDVAAAEKLTLSK